MGMLRAQISNQTFRDPSRKITFIYLCRKEQEREKTEMGKLATYFTVLGGLSRKKNQY